MLQQDEFVKAAMENEFLKNTLETGLLPMAKVFATPQIVLF